MILDGTKVAAEQLKALTVPPGLTLGIITATDDPATASYVAAKERTAAEIGITTTVDDLGSTASEADVLAACDRMNTDDSVTGYIVQLPLPPAVDREHVFGRVSPAKDADGLTPANLGELFSGHPKILPATPKGIISLLEAYKVPIKAAHVVVVGKGLLTGLPIATLLAHRDATVTTCDRYTPDLAAQTIQADIVIAAAGVPGLITANMVKPDAIVVDVGTTKRGGELLGDVAKDVEKAVGAITPVPGGVGPMTVVSLLENVVALSGD